MDGGVKEEIEEDVEVGAIGGGGVGGQGSHVHNPATDGHHGATQQVVMEIEVVEERSITEVLVDLVDLMVEDVLELEMVEMADI